MSRGPASLGLLAVLCFGIGCGGPEPLHVVARLRDFHRVTPAQSVSPRTFAAATRQAARMSPDSRFEVQLEEQPDLLRFSIARRHSERCDVPVRFRILARRGASWEELHQEAPPTGPARWADREIDLARGTPAFSRFAFETEAAWANPEQQRRCGGKVEPYWGAVAFLGRAAAPPTARAGRPDPPRGIILISLDTLSAVSLSRFGNAPGVSPNLDAWLDDAFSFERAISQYGHTRPSHASMLSGQYPHRHGATPESLLARFPSRVALLASAGYWTAAFTEGAYVSAALGYAQGFDEYDDGRRGVQTAAHTDAAATFARAGDWLEKYGTRSRFFLFVHTYEVHIPYTPRDPEARAVARELSPGVERFFTPDVQLRTTMQHARGGKRLSEGELEHLAALHSAEVHYLDRVVAGLLGRLEALGLANDTLVVVTSDHGDQFGEQGKVTHGESLHNRVHHVPLGFRWPGRVAPGATADPVQLIDVMPTLLDLAHIDSPADTDGASLVPWLLGRSPPLSRPAFSELPTARWECERLGLPFRCRLDRYAVQTGRFKLERSAAPPGEQLFDLESDPREERDVSAEHPDELARHRALLTPFVEQATRAWEAHGPAVRAPLDDAMRQQLEALGYVE